MWTHVLKILALILALGCVLVCAEEDGKSTEVRGQVQVNGGQSLMTEHVSDEPAQEEVSENPKPKKKKTPEEIEAGKRFFVLKVKVNAAVR